MSEAFDPGIVGLGISGAVNLRDVGGLPAGAGLTRSRVLYRSGELSRLDDAGVTSLGSLGLRRIIDLRADEEVSYAPSRVEGLDLRLQRVPLFLGSMSSFFTEDVSLDELYARLVDDSAAGIVDVVRGIVEDQPVLVHCTVGKDRTGVTVALTLAAAGVDEDAVIADYARSEGLLSPERNRRIVTFLQSAHPDARHVVDLATRSPGPVMRRLLDGIVQRHGTVKEYLQANGLGADELAELHRVLVAD